MTGATGNVYPVNANTAGVDRGWWNTYQNGSPEEFRKEEKLPMKGAFLVIALLFTQKVDAQETWAFPKDLKGLPITYLEELKVKDSSRSLIEKERHEICRLFVKSYVVSIRSYHQDCLLNPNTAVYHLFETNFPAVRARVGEGGIFLGAIARFINTLPEYKADVQQTLREDINPKKRCRQ